MKKSGGRFRKSEEKDALRFLMWGKKKKKKKKKIVALILDQTIPTERPQPVGEVSANFLRLEGCHVVSAKDPHGR